MRRTITLLAVLPILGLIAAACGGGGASASGYPAGFAKTFISNAESQAGDSEQAASTCLEHWVTSHLTYSQAVADFGSSPTSAAESAKEGKLADAACGLTYGNSGSTGNTGSSSGHSGNSGSSTSGSLAAFCRDVQTVTNDVTELSLAGRNGGTEYPASLVAKTKAARGTPGE